VSTEPQPESNTERKTGVDPAITLGIAVVVMLMLSRIVQCDLAAAW